jgi:alanine racemase
VARIAPAALTHNLVRVRHLAHGARVLAVIKADAYGHGLLTAARALAGADGFAVARLGEAERLRAAGLRQRILLLPGVDRRDDLGLASRLALDVAVHHEEQLRLVEQAPPGVRVGLWLKVDTGMHRLGIAPEAAAAAHARLTRSGVSPEPVRVMTHLADADERSRPTTREQVRRFRECTAGLGVESSIGNSAAVLAWPDAHGDWVRPGIMLYGVSPFAGETGAGLGLRPAMSLRTRLIAVKRVPAGGAVGYSGTFVADEDMPVGAAAAGYADGYPRHAPGGVSVLVAGRRAPLVGRVSMDMVTVDLRGHAGARVGDEVVLWGEELPVEDLAQAAGTIGYELLCRVGPRVPRVLD